MGPITIPNVGQQGAAGIPLSVQSAPTGQPTLTPPTPFATAPAELAAGATPAGASGTSPLYQQFLDSAGAAGQMASNWQSSQTPSTATPPAQRGWLQDLIGPELSAAAGGIRAIQATPDVLEMAGDAIKGNSAGAAAHKANADATLAKPIGNVKTFAGMKNEELLGAAAQVAGQGATLVGAPGIGFGLQGAGNAMQDDKGPVQVITDGLLGALAGKAGEAIAPVAGKVLGAAYDAAVPQAAQDAISGVGGKILGGLQNLSPTLAKLVPDKMTTDIVTPILDKYAPTVSKLFTSSATDAGEAGFANWTAGQTKITALRSTLGAEMDDLSTALTKQFPDATINLNTSQVKAIQTAATKAGLSLPDFMDVVNTVQVGGEDVTAELGNRLPGVNLTISQAQELGTSLNKAYEKGYVESVYDDLRQSVRTSLNDAHPGLGTVYDQMYHTASTGYQAIDSLDNIFNAKGKTLDSTNINGYISTIQNQLNDPAQKPVLQQILNTFKTSTGVDLSSETNAVAAAGNIKDPLAKRAAKGLIGIIAKDGGWIATGIGLAKHLF